jgi:hypothetical protein
MLTGMHHVKYYCVFAVMRIVSVTGTYHLWAIQMPW